MSAGRITVTAVVPRLPFRGMDYCAAIDVAGAAGVLGWGDNAADAADDLRHRLVTARLLTAAQAAQAGVDEVLP